MQVSNAETRTRRHADTKMSETCDPRLQRYAAALRAGLTSDLCLFALGASLLPAAQLDQTQQAER